jgi:hypothetical protein
MSRNLRVFAVWSAGARRSFSAKDAKATQAEVGLPTLGLALVTSDRRCEWNQV